MDMTGMKHEIEALAEAHREEFEAVSACIFEHPELAFQEKTAQNELCSLLERHGFSVKRGAGSLDTAFVAEYNSGKPGMTLHFYVSTMPFPSWATPAAITSSAPAEPEPEWF